MSATFGSLFSGVGGLDLGLEQAGWTPRWQVEIEPFRREILARHWPHVPRYEDVTTLDAKELEHVDLIAGGVPCQDWSVAGRRQGFAGARAPLFFEFARIVDAVRPRWLLFENVPGLLSACSCEGCRISGDLLREHRERLKVEACDCGRCAAARDIRRTHAGTDFAVVLTTLGSLGYRLAWRVLNSRFFGVAQKRQRVFLVGNLGAGTSDPFLPFLEGGQGHPEPRQETRPEVASTLGGGSGKRGWCDDFDRGGLSSLSGLGSGGPDDNDAQQGRLVAIPLDLRNAARSSGTGAGTQGDGIGQDGDPSFSLSATLRAVPGVAHTLTGVGHDASEDGTGRGTPLIAVPLTSGSHPASSAPGRRQEDDVNLVVAQTVTRSYARTTDAAGTHGAGPVNLIPFDRAQITSDKNYSNPQPGDPAAPLAASGDPHIATETAVRRLTTLECSRLQGFPDNWFGEPNTRPDGPRYAALGDAVTVPVAAWIGARILEADA